MNVYALGKICPYIIHSHNQFKLATTTKKPKWRRRRRRRRRKMYIFKCIGTNLLLSIQTWCNIEIDKSSWSRHSSLLSHRKLKRLRLGIMGRMAKKSGLLGLFSLVINQTRVQNFGIENIARLITRTKTRGWIKFCLILCLLWVWVSSIVKKIYNRIKNLGFKFPSTQKLMGILT